MATTLQNIANVATNAVERVALTRKALETRRSLYPYRHSRDTVTGTNAWQPLASITLGSSPTEIQ